MFYYSCKKALPIKHIITATTEERKIPTGASYYVPIASLDVTTSVELTDKIEHVW
jgi:hypothetical protein